MPRRLDGHIRPSHQVGQGCGRLPQQGHAFTIGW
jgi:hypothetical protein